MSKAFKKYIDRHPSFTNFDHKKMSASRLVVVIPVYLEDKLKDTLDSLMTCDLEEEQISILLIFNTKEGCDINIVEKQKATIDDVTSYLQNREVVLDIHIIEAFNLPKKHFGAGLARKIGMDTAIHHFYDKGIENGLILSLDADTTVDSNYFTEISGFFRESKVVGCSVYFEHPIEGTEFESDIYDAITKYELHLRYYVECLRMLDFPYAYHTVGSCFAFTADAYVRVGGMNRRQGGEEFYFIQKLIQLERYGEVNATVIHPSPRVSNRVPFGTGPSVSNMLESEDLEYYTYNLQCFIDLKEFFENREKYYQINSDEFQAEILNLPGRLRSYLLNSNFEEEIVNLSENCSSVNVFKKRFFEIFNAFRLVKYINYTHEHFIEKVPVFDAAIELLEYLGSDVDAFDEMELLKIYRNKQRSR